METGTQMSQEVISVKKEETDHDEALEAEIVMS